MVTLLILFLLIDLLASFYLYKEAFIVRSNMNKKYKKRFALMMAVIAGSAVLAWKNLPVACLIAGIPAGLISLFILGLAIAMFTHKGPWN